MAGGATRTIRALHLTVRRCIYTDARMRIYILRIGAIRRQNGSLFGAWKFVTEPLKN
jgi:hypothetical protein